ncbi:unnamed protein product [Sphagnum balticum]
MLRQYEHSLSQSRTTNGNMVNGDHTVVVLRPATRRRHTPSARRISYMLVVGECPVNYRVVQVLNLKYILLHTPMVVGDLIELLAGHDWQDMSLLFIDISNACTALHCCTNWMVRSCALCERILWIYRCSINGEHYSVNAPSAVARIRRMCPSRRLRPKIRRHRVYFGDCNNNSRRHHAQALPSAFTPTKNTDEPNSADENGTMADGWTYLIRAIFQSDIH